MMHTWGAHRGVMCMGGLCKGKPLTLALAVPPVNTALGALPLKIPFRDGSLLAKNSVMPKDSLLEWSDLIG